MMLTTAMPAGMTSGVTSSTMRVSPAEILPTAVEAPRLVAAASHVEAT